MCASVEEDHSFANMPGVRGKFPMSTGMYSQPILVRGTGYTLLGLALKACNDWASLPMMKVIEYSDVERTLVLKVDMVNRKAALYAPQQTGRGQDLIAPQRTIPVLEACASSDNLPEECG